MEKVVYVDLDGVMADFEGAFNEKYESLEGLSVDELTTYKKKFAADGFFASLEVLPGALDLIAYLNEAGYVPKILTSVGKYDSGVTSKQKSAWVDKYVRPYVEVGAFEFVTTSSDKAGFVDGPESVLVDDRTKSTVPWEEAGGTAVLYTGFESAVDVLEGVL